VTVSRLRRAAWSIPNNIAEENARRGRAQLSQFLNCAIGSLGEVDSMMSILPDLYPVEPEKLARIDSLRIRLTREIFRMMRAPGR
jgi:four helix bundle protein